MSERMMSTEQVHSDLLELKNEVKQMGAIQSDMRDAILILTENQRRIEETNMSVKSLEKSSQDNNVRLSLLEAQQATTSEKVKNIPEYNVVTKAVIFVAGAIIVAGFAFLFTLLK